MMAAAEGHTATAAELVRLGAAIDAKDEVCMHEHVHPALRVRAAARRTVAPSCTCWA